MIRIIAVPVFFISALHTIAFGYSQSTIFDMVMAYAALFSLVSAIGIFFLWNWARIYSAVFLFVASVVLVLEHVKDYFEYSNLGVLLHQMAFFPISLALVILLFSPKVKEPFKVTQERGHTLNCW